MPGSFSKVSAFSLNGQDLSSYVNNVGISITTAEIDTTPIGVVDKTFISGLNETSLSVSGFYASATIGPEGVFKAAMSLAAPVAFAYRPTGQATGYQGQAIVTSYGVSSQVGDYVAFEGELKVSGPVTIGL